MIISVLNIFLSGCAFWGFYNLFQCRKVISFFFGTLIIVSGRIIIPAALFGLFGGVEAEAQVAVAVVDRMNIANCIFLAIALPVGWLSHSVSGGYCRKGDQVDRSRVTFALSVIAFITVIIVFYSIIYHANWRQIPLAIKALTAGSGAEHYGLRGEMRHATGGLWLPSVFSNLVMAPTIMILAYIIKRTGRYKYLIWLLSIWVIYLLFNILKLQRTPVAYSLILLICVFVYLKVDFTKIGANKLAVVSFRVFGIAFVFAAGMYFFSSISNGGNFTDAILMVYRRIFLVPAVTPMGMFELFPDVFDYRGFLGVFNMGVYTQGSDIGFADVGYALTGKIFSPNSYFIGVGYSGMGMYGVVILSLLFSVMVSKCERMFSRYPANTQFLIFVCSFVGMMTLTGAPLVIAIRSFGYIVSSLVFILLLHFISSRRRM